MRTTKAWLTAAAAISLVLSTTSLPLRSQEHNAEHHVDPMTAKLRETKGEEFEKQFLQMMIEHHQSGVDMARMAQKKSKHDELRRLAEKMIADQSHEIDQMKEWLKSWHKAEPNSAVKPEASKHMRHAEMEMLQKAEGEEFDRLFLEHMSRHHQGAVSMSELVNGKTERKELREFAAKIARAQMKEINQMQSWEKEWFKKEK